MDLFIIITLHQIADSRAYLVGADFNTEKLDLKYFI